VLTTAANDIGADYNMPSQGAHSLLMPDLAIRYLVAKEKFASLVLERINPSAAGADR
jgi:hypothetical protein